MRDIRHWTPRYLVDRTRQLLYARSHPDAPWLTPRANEFLATRLRPADRGLEFGSGRSTLWFARRVQQLTSVEHDEGWHASVSRQLKEQRLTNVDYLYAPRDRPDGQGAESEYATVARRFGAGSLDFVLVDGVYRDHCAALAIPAIASGGLLIVDNANWFLPTDTRAPASRRPDQGPDGEVWAGVTRSLRGWRAIWTTNGVWDTAIFIKP